MNSSYMDSRYKVAVQWFSVGLGGGRYIL